jgi:hypothetical protein
MTRIRNPVNCLTVARLSGFPRLILRAVLVLAFVAGFSESASAAVGAGIHLIQVITAMIPEEFAAVVWAGKTVPDVS